MSLSKPNVELAMSNAATAGIAIANNNSQKIVYAIINQKAAAESAMLAASATNSIATDIVCGQAFPQRKLQQGANFPRQQQQRPAKQQQQWPQPVAAVLSSANNMVTAQKFPLLNSHRIMHKFPMKYGTEAIPKQHVGAAIQRFPSSSNKLQATAAFPLQSSSSSTNFAHTMTAIYMRQSRPPITLANEALKEFPLIKKQFFSFPNNYEHAIISCTRCDMNVNENQNNGEMTTDVERAIATTTTTTVTQTSHDKGTKIDMALRQGNAHEATFDNELKAHEQTLNLNNGGGSGSNVDAATAAAAGAAAAANDKGVGELKEIEHQQAENFNDALRQRQQPNDDSDDDAMNAAKNNRKICEQIVSKAEADDCQHHNDELNMTEAAASKNLAHKEQQQLAREQQQTIAAEALAVASVAYNHQPLIAVSSDARQTSPEQVEHSSRHSSIIKLSATATSLVVPPESLLTACVTDTIDSSSSSSACVSNWPNIAILKSAVRAFLDEGASACANLAQVLLTDTEFIDLLSDIIDFIATPTASHPLKSSEECQQLFNKCAAMTLTKVGEECDTAAAGIEIDAIEQQVDEALDDNNNSNNNKSHSNSNVNNDMKYDLKPTRLGAVPTISNHLRATLPINNVSNYSSSNNINSIAAAPPTSRMRDERLGGSASTSRMRDAPTLTEPSCVALAAESVLPERTRLRRQRRMRSQESVEEKPEDVIERLNKLKARISGALSEVKGVLKQYSTESEAEAPGSKFEEQPTLAAARTESSEAVEPPISFRFVKKVRRRSIFDEADEDAPQQTEALQQLATAEAGNTKELKPEEQQQQQPEQQQQEQPPNGNSTAEMNIKSSDKLDFLEQVQNELRKKHKIPEQQQQSLVADATAIAATEATATAPTTVVTVEHDVVLPTEPNVELLPIADVTPAEAMPPVAKPKKKIIIKTKNPRRASIAAVEGSQIEPPIASPLSLAERRPSDSEAIVKRKKKEQLTSIVEMTSGSEAKRKSNAATTTIPKTATTLPPTSEQLAVAAAKVNENTAKRVPLTIAKSSDSNDKEDTTRVTESEPKQLSIAGAAMVGNQAPASNRNRRASLILAELVGETVLVAPATTQQAAASQSSQSQPLSEFEAAINQTEIIPVATLHAASSTPTHQQVIVAADIEVAAASGTDIASIALPVVASAQPTPQIAATLSEQSHEESSSAQQIERPPIEATKDNAQPNPPHSLAAMPELQVQTGPVQPVKIETVEPSVNDTDQSHHELVGKKKTSHLKKLVRKVSLDKEKSDATKLNNILKDKNKISGLAANLGKLTPPKKQTKATSKTEEAAVEAVAEPEPELEPAPEPAPEAEPEPKPKKPRKIKKKVIIKCQKRRLSISDSFFQQNEPAEPKTPEIETIEKAIAYVTDDEADEQNVAEIAAEPPKPLKSCMHVREYKVGDLVLYAERYRKTQVRWKRGRVLERITSISYKLDIEGKEVAAHISYIKKYTGRKVKFGGKEYLEIDYEQVAEEERRAHSYSIWNMV